MMKKKIHHSINHQSIRMIIMLESKNPSGIYIYIIYIYQSPGIFFLPGLFVCLFQPNEMMVMMIEKKKIKQENNNKNNNYIWLTNEKK